MPVKILTYSSKNELAQGLAKTVARELTDALSEKARATLAVPGGTTPGPFLNGLSREQISWENVSVMLTDERFVPETSMRSNTRLLRETLLTNNAAVAHMVPFYKEAAQPEDVLEELQKSILSALPLDVCVLGMGEDMHTASLFPRASRQSSRSSVFPETDNRPAGLFTNRTAASK